MQIREILAIKGKVLFTVGPDVKLKETVAVMTEHDVGSVICFDKGRMVGLITFREVLNAVHQNGANWEVVPVSEIMQSKPVTADPDMEMTELRRMMVEKHARYLPVMEGATLMGVVSFHDVAKAVLEEQSFENRMLKAYIRDWPEGEERPGV